MSVIKNNWRVLPEHIKKVKKLAAKNKCSESQIIRDMIEDYKLKEKYES